MTGAVEIKQNLNDHARLHSRLHAAWNWISELVSGRWIARWAESLGDVDDEAEDGGVVGEIRLFQAGKVSGWIRVFEERNVSERTDASGNTGWEQETAWKQTEKCGSSRQELNRRAEDLLDHYGNHILRLAYSYLHNMEDSEEILQETLLKCLQENISFENAAHEKAWLLRVAANVSKNRIRYNRSRETDELDEQLVADERNDLSFVWEAVKALPDTYREAIHLFYYEGYQTAQIASILGRKESTVRSDLRRGRERLKEILKEVYDFEEV